MDGQRQLEIENFQTSINSYKAEKQEIDNSLKKQLETINNLKYVLILFTLNYIWDF